jgi:macrolide-specific efflux system membrane fusion protein
MTRRRRAWLINGTLVAVVVLAAGGAGYFLFGNKLQLTSSDSASGLRTTTVRTGDVTQSVSANGTIASQSTAAANFGVSGTVATLKVGVGTKVTKGEILATLDTTTFQAAVDEAQAAVTAAQASVDAAQAASTASSSGSGGTSTAQKQSQVASANSQLAQAQSTLTTAEKNLSETTLTAPIAGTVMAVSGAVGDTVSGSGNSTGTGSAGSTGNSANGNNGQSNNNSSSSSSASSSSSSSGFVSIYDMGHLEIDASFAEADAGKLQVGQTSSVTINALPNADVTATVASIDELPTASGSVVEYGATLTLSAAPDGVRIGQSASVAVTVAQASNVLTVSPTAVTTAGGQSTVTVLRNGKQVRTVVQLGVKGDSAYQVTSGVTAGETLVLPSVTTSSSGNGFPNGSFPGTGNGGFGRRGTGTGTGVTGSGLTGGGR